MSGAALRLYQPVGRRITVTATDETEPLIHLGWSSGGVYVSVTEALALAHQLLTSARGMAAQSADGQEGGAQPQTLEPPIERNVNRR